MKQKEKKEYLLYAFRITSEEKRWLEAEVDKLHGMLNSQRSEGTYAVKKHDIILEALKLGLPKVKLR